MSIRSLVRAGALAVSVAILLAIPASASGAATAKLRLLGPDFNLEQAWFVTGSANIPTSPQAKCFFGGEGGSGHSVHLSGPTALGLVKHASKWNESLLPFRITDEFEFGLGVCGFGGHVADDSSFWYLKVNHQEPTAGGDQVKLHDGDRVVWYLAPNNFPNPNPIELVLHTPASADPGVPFQVSVTAWSCTTDFPSTCTEGPAANASVRVNGAPVTTTNANGNAFLVLTSSATVQAVRGADMPAKSLHVCVDPPEADDCPPPNGFGRKIFGRDKPDTIYGTNGWDEIHGGRGSDVIRIWQGGSDEVFCGRGNRDYVSGVGHDDTISKSCERIRRA